MLHAAHDDYQGGHQGVSRTFDRLRREFYWNGMYRDVETPSPAEVADLPEEDDWDASLLPEDSWEADNQAGEFEELLKEWGVRGWMHDTAVRVGTEITASCFQSFAASIQLLIDVIASTQGIFLARPSFAQLALHLSQLSQCGHQLLLATL
ncbi:hypothetical protein P43SY_005425 [Pythium insidiosum]|uniref:Integrase zinc-binding domain-containing protein n=1 Tax=Pythium insidiosum TaxID=114742 RepID=A0AAD5Q381_PYTIN|nr:hypothetical protein P43SY_005425 [Pythium insidiosum]